MVQKKQVPIMISDTAVKKIKELTIPDSLAYTSDYPLGKIKELIIPDSVAYIRDYSLRY